ncbi:MAG: glycoside hydrolase family 2 protein [Oscillospiraceae bacterium]
MLTPWGEKLQRDAVWQEYPRPQLRRDSYLNLNGEWDYAITREPEPPTEWDGLILVPFSPEAELSGVGRVPEPDEFLWYHRTVELPQGFRRGRLLLHFGAVDQVCAVFVNGQPVISHVGGYTPFSADVTEAAPDERLELLVRVQDSTDRSCHSRGKQKRRRGGIWYTAQSGIWQTVWMESVPESYIRGLRLIPRFDREKIELWVAGEGLCRAEIGGQTHQFPAGEPVVLPLPGEMHPWSPEDPYLYDLTLTLGEDRVESYFAMRKFSVEPDGTGQRRLFLNGKPYFQNGLLDQGYWPDGLLTAPSDEAMIFDIQTAKASGFNMLRKHAKLEPLRWYYHCDRLGMLVWQDMPNGGGRYNPLCVSAPLVTGIHVKDSKYGFFARRDEAGREQYYAELREMVNTLVSCPCVAVWVPFNEGWGQFDARAACERIWNMDQSRPIDHASGWHDQGFGELKSLHVYYREYHFEPDKRNRAVVLSEFGGYNHRVEGHAFGKKDFGYKRFDSANSLQFALRELYKGQIVPAWREGLSAAVYTQLSDVEDELNGLVTYDRRVVKIAPEMLRGIVKMSEK